jgi:hypothetical protein
MQRNQRRGMTSVRPRKLDAPLLGHEKPRLAPPWPLNSLDRDFRDTAKELGINLYPWQETAAHYINAVGPKKRWLYREVAIVVARQNGKSTLLIPLIVSRLRAGQKIMHTAQNRKEPTRVFLEVAEIIAQDQTLFPERNGRPVRPRYANGQEEIRLNNGGLYRIVAPTSNGARGSSNDLVIVDEVRELDEFAFYGAARSTMLKSENGQMLLLSNAGEDKSVVLNAVRLRADTDPALAYLEWSASPERAADDRDGWAEANPAIGHDPNVVPFLEGEFRTHSLQGTLPIFETENLCRQVATMRQHLVDEFAWARSRFDELEPPRRPAMAVSMSPDGKRSSVAVAWMRPDLTVGLRLLYNVSGNPIDSALLGKDLRATANRLGIKSPGFDPLTDKELAKYFVKAKPISGQEFANASAQFVNLVNSDHIRWADADAVTDDLTWTSRKQDHETGSYQAVRAQDDRSITASLAAIRAVWLASGPKPSTPKVM